MPLLTHLQTLASVLKRKLAILSVMPHPADISAALVSISGLNNCLHEHLLAAESLNAGSRPHSWPYTCN